MICIIIASGGGVVYYATYRNTIIIVETPYMVNVASSTGSFPAPPSCLALF